MGNRESHLVPPNTVLSIRRARAAGGEYEDVARQYGVAPFTVRRIALYPRTRISNEPLRLALLQSSTVTIRDVACALGWYKRSFSDTTRHPDIHRVKSVLGLIERSPGYIQTLIATRNALPIAHLLGVDLTPYLYPDGK